MLKVGDLVYYDYSTKRYSFGKMIGRIKYIGDTSYIRIKILKCKNSNKWAFDGTWGYHIDELKCIPEELKNEKNWWLLYI